MSLSKDRIVSAALCWVFVSISLSQGQAISRANAKLSQLGWRSDGELSARLVQRKDGKGSWILRDLSSTLILDEDLDLTHASRTTIETETVPLHGRFSDDAAVLSAAQPILSRLGLPARAKLEVLWPNRDGTGRSAFTNVVRVLGNESPGKFRHERGYGNTFAIGLHLDTGELVLYDHSGGWTYSDPKRLLSVAQAESSGRAFLVQVGFKASEIKLTAASSEPWYLGPAPAVSTDAGAYWVQQRHIRVGYVLCFNENISMDVDGETGEVLTLATLNSGGGLPDAGAKISAYANRSARTRAIFAIAAGGLLVLGALLWFRRARFRRVSQAVSR